MLVVAAVVGRRGPANTVSTSADRLLYQAELLAPAACCPSADQAAAGGQARVRTARVSGRVSRLLG